MPHEVRKKSILKSNHHQIYDEILKKRKQRKIIKPGPWSLIEPKIKVVAKIKKNESRTSFSDYLGKYITHDTAYKKDGYRVIMKIFVDNLPLVVKKYGIDQVLAACERSLNSYKYSSGKKVLGDLVIMDLLYDERSKREHYLPCLVKTNKRRLPKFMGMSQGMLRVF